MPDRVNQRLDLGFVRAIDREQEAADGHVILGRIPGTSKARDNLAPIVVAGQRVDKALDERGFLTLGCLA